MIFLSGDQKVQRDGIQMGGHTHIIPSAQGRATFYFKRQGAERWKGDMKIKA